MKTVKSSKDNRTNLRDYLPVFGKILRPEFSFYMVTIIYGIGVSILTLAIPISVQSLVNTVTFGVLVQPLIVISLVLFSLLIFSGVLNALQAYMIEMFQRHFYARITGDIVANVLNADFIELRNRNAVSLVNKYFDVMTVQKSMTTLLTGGISIVLQTIVGLILLAFYHPYFLAFDIILIFSIYLVWVLFGKKAVSTAILESKAKYQVADWLQELGRANHIFKSERRKREALLESDKQIRNYLDKRKYHFRKLFAQTVMLLSIYAFMSSVILGLGGYLVIVGQLTLGQLVAAELIVTIILAGFSKGGKYLESFYDLVAATEKINHFYNIKFNQDEIECDERISEVDGFDLKFSNLSSTNRGKSLKINYDFKMGEKYRIQATSFSAKMIFLELIQKYYLPDMGNIQFGNVSFSDLPQNYLGDRIYVVDRPTMVEGTVLSNLKLIRPKASSSEINEALDIVELDHLEAIFPDGLEAKALESGFPLWSSQFIRFEIAKCILAKPEIVILSDVFEQIESNRKRKILKYFFEQNITLLVFTNGVTKEFDFKDYLLLTNDGVKSFESEEELCKEFSRVSV